MMASSWHHCNRVSAAVLEAWSMNVCGPQGFQVKHVTCIRIHVNENTLTKVSQCFFQTFTAWYDICIIYIHNCPFTPCNASYFTTQIYNFQLPCSNLIRHHPSATKTPWDSPSVLAVKFWLSLATSQYFAAKIRQHSTWRWCRKHVLGVDQCEHIYS